MAWVSPSSPMSIGASDVTSNDGVHHESKPSKRSGWPADAARNAALPPAPMTRP